MILRQQMVIEIKHFPFGLMILRRFGLTRGFIVRSFQQCPIEWVPGCRKISRLFSLIKSAVSHALPVQVKIACFGVSDIPLDAIGMKTHFAWAKKLGLEVLVTEVTPNQALDKIAGETGIQIALHNHPESWPADKVLAATQDLSKNCGSCADTGHWLRAGKDPIANLKLLAGRVIESHFKDVDDQKSDVVFGTGISNIKGMMQELKRQRFHGHLNIEYEHGDLAHLDATIPLCVAAFDKIAAAVAKE